MHSRSDRAIAATRVLVGFAVFASADDRSIINVSADTGSSPARLLRSALLWKTPKFDLRSIQRI